MVSVQCLLWLSINAVSNQSWVQNQEQEISIIVAEIATPTAYTYANTTIELPKLTSVGEEVEGVVYSDRSLFSKRVSFVI
jgi:hypothetical protein